jgi:phosphoribosylformylglycinamidine cyclo-ligase
LNGAVVGEPDANWPQARTPLRDRYSDSGVSIDSATDAVERYREIAATWRHPSQLEGIGAFAGAFRLPGDNRRALVASTDGVGTKTLIAAALRRYRTVGADLVNHCVNDILVLNATPLFFLDYLAVGKLDPAIAAEIVSGIHDACRAHETALLGGETAEMPGLYRPDHFDLAGTIVGIVDVDAIPDPERVRPGDAIVGLPARGLHTNGYSLARATIPEEDWARYGDALLAEHPSYYRAVRAIGDVADVKAMAHITGGGLSDNVPRTLPAACKAIFEQSRWEVPPFIADLVRTAGLSHDERYRTLNMGIGFTLVVSTADAVKALRAVPEAKVIGWIEMREAGEPAVVIHPVRTA